MKRIDDRGYSFQLIATLAMAVLAAPASPVSAITLKDEQGKTYNVSKDRFIVYLFIGHSNMAGRNASQADGKTHPRAWNYRWYSDKKWIPAKETSSTGLTPRGSGGPGMPFLKAMASSFPGYHFGVIQNANTQATVRTLYRGQTQNRYWKGYGLYKEVVGAALAVQKDVTIGGIIAMLGYMEQSAGSNADAKRFSDDVKQMVADMRQALGQPNLPFLIGRAEEGASRKGPYFSIIKSETLRVPGKLARSAVVDRDGPYSDDHHFSMEGHRRWSARAVEILQGNGWVPLTQSNAPPTVRIDQPAQGSGFVVGEAIGYAGSGTDPEDGNLSGSSLVWTYDIADDGQGSVNIGTGQSGILKAPAHPKGTYPYTLSLYLTAKDKQGMSHETPTQVTIAAEQTNFPPIANAGSTQTVLGGDSVLLDGSSSRDPDGDTLTYAWTQVSGPKVNLTGEGSMKAAFEAPQVDQTAQVTFRLEISDGSLLDTAEVAVTVAPRASVTLLSPQGGEVWTAGSRQVIRWKAVGYEDVDLQYSTDGGATWTRIGYSEAQMTSWESYPWTVPDTPTARAILRVSGYFGESEDLSGTFEIASGSATEDMDAPVIRTLMLGLAGTIDDPSVTRVSLSGLDVPVLDGAFRGTAGLVGVSSELRVLGIDASGNKATRTLKVDR